MSLGKTIESLIDAGMTPNEAIRSSGSICSGGPLGPLVMGAWAKHPMVGTDVAHWWDRLTPSSEFDPAIVFLCETPCGVFSVETKSIPLLGEGNMRRCKKCERAMR